jgi:NodT family efflux transporter outer membrane factor (OMF) lipoprotein
MVWSVPVSPASNGTKSLWWERLGGFKLAQLMRQAFESNADLLAAAYRVKRAQLQSQWVDTNRNVSWGMTASVNHSQDLNGGNGVNSTATNVLLSYEVDLWGKLAKQRDISQWQSQATQNDCEALSLSLSGTVVNLYWQIAQLNQLISLGEIDIESARKTAEIVDHRFDAGAVSGIAKSQAAVNLANQQAAQTRLVQSRVELRHAMAALLSRQPSFRVDELPELPTVDLPPVQADLPAEVLKKRPDLHAAEMRLRASFSQIDVVRTSFYPSLSLTGGLGTASSDLVSFGKNPVVFLGGLLALPFIQMNAQNLNIQVSQSEFDEAVALFKQRLYTALAEVEDALSAKQQLQIAYEQERIAKDQAALVEARIETQYRTGFVALQPWLDARQSLRNAQRALVYTRFNQLVNESKLYMALGAGSGSLAGTCKAR